MALPYCTGILEINSLLTALIAFFWLSFCAVKGIVPVRFLEADSVIVGEGVVCDCSPWSSSFLEHRCKSKTGYIVVTLQSNCQGDAQAVIWRDGAGDITDEGSVVITPHPIHLGYPISTKTNRTRDVQIFIVTGCIAFGIRFYRHITK